MTNERPNVTRDGHYCLSDTARILSVSTQTLRRHTQLGLITCSRWSHNGRAFYTGKEIVRYWNENASRNMRYGKPKDKLRDGFIIDEMEITQAEDYLQANARFGNAQKMADLADTLPKVNLPLQSCKEIQTADVIIDVICHVGEVSYFDFLFAPKSTKLSTIRGICCVLAWEYKVHARRMAKMMQRTRGNVLNQQRTYRHLLQAKDKLSVEIYEKAKSEVNIRLQTDKGEERL